MVRTDTSDQTHSEAVHNVLTNSLVHSLAAVLAGFFTQRVVGQWALPGEWSQHQTSRAHGDSWVTCAGPGAGLSCPDGSLPTQ